MRQGPAHAARSSSSNIRAANGDAGDSPRGSSVAWQSTLPQTNRQLLCRTEALFRPFRQARQANVTEAPADASAKTCLNELGPRSVCDGMTAL